MYDLKFSLDFLNNLTTNNDRVWFNDHKADYNKALGNFSKLIDDVIAEVKKFDDFILINSAKDCLFRIYKDVRFSKNKEPYKTNFGAHIAHDGRKSKFAGYYLHMQPGGSFIGGGMYAPEPDALNKVRWAILDQPEEFKSILENKNFKKSFGSLMDEKLKSAPRGFPKDNPNIELTYYKHYVVTQDFDDSRWTDPTVLSQVIDIFKAQYDFNRFINLAIMH